MFLGIPNFSTFYYPTYENYHHKLCMQFSGYNEKFRKEVLRSAIEAYKRIKRDVREGKKMLYRNKQWQNKRKMEQKRNTKANWYKQKSKNKNPQPKNQKSILLIQPTMGSQLKKEYKRAIERSKCEIKLYDPQIDLQMIFF